MLRSERGQNLVELALVLPLLILLLAGIADVGRAFFSYIQLTNAAREGARAASRLPCYSEASGIPGAAAQRLVYAERIRDAVRAEVDDVFVLRDGLEIDINPPPNINPPPEVHLREFGRVDHGEGQLSVRDDIVGRSRDRQLHEDEQLGGHVKDRATGSRERAARALDAPT